MRTPTATQTLTARLEAAAERGGSIIFVNGEVHVPVRWAQVLDDARGYAAGLQAAGVGPGDHVAVLGPTTRSLITTFEAVWLCGATLVVLPIPMRMGAIDEFIEATRNRIRRSDAALFVIDDEFADFYTPTDGDPPLTTYAALATAEAAAYVRPPDDPDALAILQFTSGSTNEPKGVMLPHRAVCANLDAIAIAASYDVDDDVLVSWLPLYHDMGLIGLYLTAACGGGDFVLAAPQDFLAKPLRWMEWLSQYGGTATAGPNFSYALATRALRRAENLDLSRLRVALNGAEPIDPESVRDWQDAGAKFGMRPGSVFPAFGMAEVCIAGTFPVPMTGLRTDHVDRVTLEAERFAAPAAPDATTTRELVRLGWAVPGLEVRIADVDSGKALRDREVGELQIRGTSVTPGYYGRPEATAEAFVDGWFRTGDLAYTVDGDLVLCGRIKDVIIIGGRNIFPEDIERAAATIEGVRPGNIIAFGIEGRRHKETVVVVAETKGGDLAEIRELVHHAVLDAVGVPPHDVVLVEPGTLPKTSSGKLQRSLCRKYYTDQALQPVG